MAVAAEPEDFCINFTEMKFIDGALYFKGKPKVTGQMQGLVFCSNVFNRRKTLRNIKCLLFVTKFHCNTNDTLGRKYVPDP